ncbi:hypothetical protein PR048_003136 [Dryococelus australis]|uniref:Tc1-like transposase DDE domain-containing protein n=1 Tax=Dryococelus australis TaxID=614101 RepID=A0ABQ9IN68_9NEOP|nr:hypothetical protein PR048_003136 [Dryococelus australis]
MNEMLHSVKIREALKEFIHNRHRRHAFVTRREYLCAVKRTLNEGHSVSKVWVNITVISKRNAFMGGLSTGLKIPPEDGKRLIILQVESVKGFVDGELLSFMSKTSNDCYEEMTMVCKVGLLPSLDENSVIVIDNAPYHNAKLEKILTKVEVALLTGYETKVSTLAVI